MSLQRVKIGLIIGVICLIVMAGIAAGAKTAAVGTKPIQSANLIDPNTGKAVQIDPNTGMPVKVAASPALSAAKVQSMLSPATANWELLWSPGIQARYWGDPKTLPSSLNSEIYLASIYAANIKAGSSQQFTMPIEAPMITDGKGPAIKTLYLQMRTYASGMRITGYTVYAGLESKGSASGLAWNIPSTGSATTFTITLPAYTQFNEGACVIYFTVTNTGSSSGDAYIVGAGEVLEYS